MNLAAVEAGSFRDPSGHVYTVGKRIFRTVTERAAPHYEFVRQTGLFERLVASERIVGAVEVDKAILGRSAESARYVLEHPQLPFVSYPYEWCFSALKAAAILHLELHLEALNYNVTIADASAYNVQFQGARPTFIDHLSFRRYRAGEFWLGHRQFCEQFLNPLLLRNLFGIPHNAWYRGSMEGITAAELARLLKWPQKLSWNVISHVVLQAKLQTVALESGNGALHTIKKQGLTPAAFRRVLTRLSDWTSGLFPADTGTTWASYEETHTYTSEEETAKRKFVAEFVSRTKPGLLWDLGCNTGQYSALATEAGARFVVGFDYDQGALERAFAHAQAKRLNFLPLFLDAGNPSPSQGWAGGERKSLQARAKPDALIALAFVHHLAIGRNIPLELVVDWITSLAPQGVIEFVHKSDPTVQRMLELREDIFPEYTSENFLRHLSDRVRIEKVATISQTGRQLIWFSGSKD